MLTGWLQRCIQPQSGWRVAQGEATRLEGTGKSVQSVQSYFLKCFLKEQQMIPKLCLNTVEISWEFTVLICIIWPLVIYTFPLLCHTTNAVILCFSRPKARQSGIVVASDGEQGEKTRQFSATLSGPAHYYGGDSSSRCEHFGSPFLTGGLAVVECC